MKIKRIPIGVERTTKIEGGNIEQIENPSSHRVVRFICI
ncbi:hypothetical protein ADU37_CDS17420 [Thermococcus sp. 2319x1]|nr:hypothetical protein ADU37_CDS17420 [Thermococcus sp. 2319x1]